MNKKQLWEKPKLIVIVRGKPEELVLSHCKGFALDGPESNYGGLRPCWIEIGGCVECSNFGAS